jgi:hypothetical protein
MRIISRVVLCLLVGIGCMRSEPSSGMIYQVSLMWAIVQKPNTPLMNLSVMPIIRRQLGTAVAVDADGGLLTARHVVDIGMHEEENFSSICDMKNVERVELELDISDSLGRHWLGHASAKTAEEMLCDYLGRVRLRWDSDSVAHVIALGGVVDIALVQIDARGIEHVILDPGVQPKPDEPIALEGRPFGWVSLRTRGSVMRGCRKEHYGDKWLLIDQPVVEMNALVYPGMSGGMVLDGDTFIGLIVMQGDPYGSFAVSGSYAAQWYEWARGRAKRLPSNECPQ